MRVEKLERITLDKDQLETLSAILREAAGSWGGEDILLLAQIFNRASSVRVVTRGKQL